jgi:putative tryptophan/tyrosine transport system substrate-binding protein
VKRRSFISLLGGAAAAWPLAARAQQGERVRRIGVLMGRAAGDAEGQKQAAVLRRGLEELHWLSARNLDRNAAVSCRTEVCYLSAESTGGTGQ